EDRLLQGPAVACRILEIVGEARGVDQQLLGNAAANYAGPADAVFLRNEYPRTVLRGNSSCADTAGARADDEEIDVVLSHLSRASRPSASALRCEVGSWQWRPGAPWVQPPAIRFHAHAFSFRRASG